MKPFHFLRKKAGGRFPMPICGDESLGHGFVYCESLVNCLECRIMLAEEVTAPAPSPEPRAERSSPGGWPSASNSDQHPQRASHPR